VHGPVGGAARSGLLREKLLHFHFHSRNGGHESHEGGVFFPAKHVLPFSP
jgi:hypothetical protein